MTVLVLVAVLGVTSGAVAGVRTVPAGSSDARIARLKREVGSLRLRLQDMTAARNKAKVSLRRATDSRKSSQKQLAAANQQIASLQTLVTQRTSERDAALQRAAALQVELAAVPQPLALAQEQVRREVGWAEYEYKANGTPYSDGRLVALSAMNYVVGHVSTGAYGYLEVFGGALPTSNSDSILEAQAGICGHAALTFAAILKHFGYSVRSVQFYYTTPDASPDSHIADEVFYDGAWHFFDPTFGLYWTAPDGGVLTITEARAGGGSRHKDDVSFTNLIEDPWFAGDDTAFETDPATTVDIDAQPF
jgi:hypothetical protein